MSHPIHVLHRSAVTGTGGKTIHAGGSVYEYAWKVYPSGASDTDYKGNAHGHDTETSFTIEVDGTPVSITDGNSESGSEVVITRVSELDHPEAASKMADITTVYTLNADGLRVKTTANWLQTLDVGRCYGRMLPLDADFTSARMSGTGKYLLTDDDDSEKGGGPGDGFWAWDTGGNVAGSMVTVDGNVHDGWWQDRADLLNKAYVRRDQSISSVVSGDQWVDEGVYQAAWLADADATLDV